MTDYIYIDLYIYRFISLKNQLSDTSNTFFMSVTVQSQSALLQRNTQTHICPPQARNFYISDDFTLGNHIFLLHRTFETSNFPRPYRGETLGAVIYISINVLKIFGNRDLYISLSELRSCRKLCYSVNRVRSPPTNIFLSLYRVFSLSFLESMEGNVYFKLLFVENG